MLLQIYADTLAEMSALELCGPPVFTYLFACKVSKGAKFRNRYNQVPHLTQDFCCLLTTFAYSLDHDQY